MLSFHLTYTATLLVAAVMLLAQAGLAIALALLAAAGQALALGVSALWRSRARRSGAGPRNRALTAAGTAPEPAAPASPQHTASGPPPT